MSNENLDKIIDCFNVQHTGVKHGGGTMEQCDSSAIILTVNKLFPNSSEKENLIKVFEAGRAIEKENITRLVKVFTNEEIDREFSFDPDMAEGAKWMLDQIFGKPEVPKDKLVFKTYKFPNGNVATFGYDDKQIPELQGTYSEELRNKIKERSDDKTEWNGF